MGAATSSWHSFARALLVETVARLDPGARVSSALADMDYAAPETTIVALGKAARPMARGALAYLAAREHAVVGGVVVSPAGTALDAADDDILAHGLAVVESAHPIPDQRSVRAARALMDAVANTPVSSRVLALVSGGGSALAALPAPGVSLADKVAVTARLAERGATIQELNTVRKQLSAIKGGGLARVSPVPVTTLVASDVVGDDASMVASGPTIPDATTVADARAVIERYLGWDGLPASVVAHLQRCEAEPTEARAAAAAVRVHDRARVIAGTETLVHAAVAAARDAGARAEILAHGVTGDVHEVALFLARAARELGSRVNPGEMVCAVAGGEPTLALPATHGVGGRAQHLALLVAREIAGLAHVAVLCAGSDGIDGASQAAGAIVDGTTWAALGAASVDRERAIHTCDSSTALAAVDAQLVTGPTGVNHADLMVLMARGEPGC